MKMIFKILSVIAASLVVSLSYADEAEFKQLEEALKEKMPDLEITEISSTPVPGILELLTGGDVIYMTPDAKYMFQGNLIDLDARANLTQNRLGQVHMTLINEMPDEETVIFAPEKTDNMREITVFTDTSCPYCSKLHEEVDELNAAGIKVRYLLYPRAGLGSPAHKELMSVWCADDQQSAMTAAKRGQNIEEKICDTPIEKHIALAQQVGLRGTPLIYLDSGEIISGYRPADAIIKSMEGSVALK